MPTHPTHTQCCRISPISYEKGIPPEVVELAAKTDLKVLAEIPTHDAKSAYINPDKDTSWQVICQRVNAYLSQHVYEGFEHPDFYMVGDEAGPTHLLAAPHTEFHSKDFPQLQIQMIEVAIVQAPKDLGRQIVSFYRREFSTRYEAITFRLRSQLEEAQQIPQSPTCNESDLHPWDLVGLDLGLPSIPEILSNPSVWETTHSASVYINALLELARSAVHDPEFLEKYLWILVTNPEAIINFAWEQIHRIQNNDPEFLHNLSQNGEVHP